MNKLYTIFLALIALILCACSQSRQGWVLEGNIEGAADSTLYIETSNLGNWYVVDSVVVGDNGDFSYQSLEPDSITGIYRVRLGKTADYIYFPAQGSESIKLAAKAQNFSRNYKLTGTDAAVSFNKVDNLINATIDRLGIEGALKDSALRADLNQMINRDTTCIVSYYIINKHLGPTLFYDLSRKQDLSMLGNAAQNYKTRHPEDPRAKELEDRFIAVKKQMSPAVSAPELENIPENMKLSRPNIDIKLYDNKGKLQDFEKIVTRGGVTVLNFTRFDGAASPANTVALNKVYEKYHGNGLEIYQISFDPDELNWKRNAANMPWITVWTDLDQGAPVMIAYNVNPIDAPPTSFVFDRQGTLVARVSDPTTLDAKIAALLQ